MMTWSHPPGGRLPLLSARPAVTFPAEERHRSSAGTKLYCLVTEARACEQPTQGCHLEANRPRFEPATFRIASERSTVKPHRPRHDDIKYHLVIIIVIIIIIIKLAGTCSMTRCLSSRSRSASCRSAVSACSRALRASSVFSRRNCSMQRRADSSSAIS